jgi:DNA-binding response OmpR family regulator
VTGFQAGGVDYITKPFQPAEVLARVTTHLMLHRPGERAPHYRPARRPGLGQTARSTRGLHFILRCLNQGNPKSALRPQRSIGN